MTHLTDRFSPLDRSGARRRATPRQAARDASSDDSCSLGRPAFGGPRWLSGCGAPLARWHRIARRGAPTRKTTAGHQMGHYYPPLVLATDTGEAKKGLVFCCRWAIYPRDKRKAYAPDTAIQRELIPRQKVRVEGPQSDRTFGSGSPAVDRRRQGHLDIQRNQFGRLGRRPAASPRFPASMPTRLMKTVIWCRWSITAEPGGNATKS